MEIRARPEKSYTGLIIKETGAWMNILRGQNMKNLPAG